MQRYGVGTYLWRHLDIFMQTKIIIADDHGIFRAGLKALLELEPDLVVLGDVDDGIQAMTAAMLVKPDLMTMDLSMPNCNGTEAISAIIRCCPHIKILALTVHREEEYVRACLQAGAHGYILKDDSHDNLITGLRTVLRGKTYISPSVSQQIISGYLNPISRLPGKTTWDRLTRREREVLKLVAQGKKNREIAEFLVISQKTIEKHRSNLMQKLQCRNIPALIRYAVSNGLVTC